MPKLNAEFITISVHIKRDTDKAVLIVFHEDEHWIPRSQIEAFDYDGTEARITITAWIAKEKGII